MHLQGSQLVGNDIGNEGPGDLRKIIQEGCLEEVEGSGAGT